MRQILTHRHMRNMTNRRTPQAYRCHTILNILLCRHLLRQTGYFWINDDAPAVFTHYYFLMHLYFKLLLRWNAIETSATGITLYAYEAKTVAGIFAYSLEC